MAEFRFREDPLPYDPDFSSASFGPYSVSANIRPDVAIMAVSGWLDGAGYANGAISRFLTLDRHPRHLLLGPWDHGACVHVSPWSSSQIPEFGLLGEVLRFFDHYLMRRDTGLNREDPIHYYAMHAEEWRSASSWPPVAEMKQLFFDGAKNETGLVWAHPAASEPIVAKADFTWGSGCATRYERIAGRKASDYYRNWQSHESKLIGLSSAPIENAMELVGHGVVDLWLSSNEPDASIFVYLSEVESDGTVRYVTEGLLRALHRRESDATKTYRTTWPFRAYNRQDAIPLSPGLVERIRIPLLPTAWVFNAGSRIRISFSGADAEHFGQVPHGRPPTLTFSTGGEVASVLQLPLR